MDWSIAFFLNSALLGVGLAMDAFSVSVANGLNNPAMKKTSMVKIASVFAFFQWLMPIVGWVCVHTIVQYFRVFEKAIPWIALLLLCFIGGKMLREAISASEEESLAQGAALGFWALIVQGIATSIDALSVGFAIAEYGGLEAFVCAVLIAVVTFVICMGGLVIGKTAGTKFSKSAGILGGCILIFIGFEIFFKGII